MDSEWNNLTLICSNWWTKCVYVLFFFFVSREVRHASCGYIPRSSWVTLSGPRCPHQVQPAYVWPRRRRSPVRCLRRTPQSIASVCQSPALSRAGKASPRWRCPAASTGETRTVSGGNALAGVTLYERMWAECCSFKHYSRCVVSTFL